jgi:HTH-type transcriptional regulator/antitoxin HigA
VIKNERQHLITKAQAKKFKEAIEAFDNKTTDTPPLLAKAQREALESQLAELKWQLDEYEKLRSGKLKRLKKSSRTFSLKRLLGSCLGGCLANYLPAYLNGIR